MNKRINIVTIGGGTGQFMLLSELKKHPQLDITTIVVMGDSGGSTGVLRDELGVLPPGDIRQALVALSRSENTLRELFNYRFDSPSLEGHSFGNLFISTLEKISGSFEHAVKEASKILAIRGQVVPSATESFHIIAENEHGQFIYSEGEIDKHNTEEIKRVFLDRKVATNTAALDAIAQADIIVYCPGTFFCSLVPHLLLDNFSDALQQSQAQKIFCTNLMTTNHFTVEEYVSLFESYAKGSVVDKVIYNNNWDYPEELQERYKEKGEYVVKADDLSVLKNIKLCGADLMDRAFAGGLVRHNAHVLVEKILENSRE